MDTPRQNTFHLCAIVSLLGLTILCIAWEWVLAPLKPGGSWMVLKALPLLWIIRGVLKRNLYTLQWSSMAILLYFVEGVVRSVSDVDPFSSLLAGLEIGLVAIYFFCVLAYLRPYKNAAKQARKGVSR